MDKKYACWLVDLNQLIGKVQHEAIDRNSTIMEMIQSIKFHVPLIPYLLFPYKNPSLFREYREQRLQKERGWSRIIWKKLEGLLSKWKYFTYVHIMKT